MNPGAPERCAVPAPHVVTGKNDILVLSIMLTPSFKTKHVNKFYK
jgi:hypothetical protein